MSLIPVKKGGFVFSLSCRKQLSGVVLNQQNALPSVYSIKQSRNTTGVPELDPG